MLFNSFEFIFLFLPITLALYFLTVRRWGLEFGLSVLVLASLIFYGYWNPAYLGLIIFSIIFNYLVGSRLSHLQGLPAKLTMITGVTINLLLLGYFKYANFFVDNINAVIGADWHLRHIILPLAISFFTFQQISYLVDAWQGNTREYNFLHYTLFVCFFPQLIAGPIVHHKEMLPQFMTQNSMQPRMINFAVGVSIFAVGLFKKTIIADSLSVYVSPVYDNPGAMDSLEFFSAWGSTLAYTFQLYFDFSGYSDMAIGCARMFGICLPLNFFSPYKATSIVEFWRRWHVSLSRFLRDYLYIALGGNKKGKMRRYFNLFMTMLLGGLWHGAGWPFVVWGMLHGSFLIINHSWRWLLSQLGLALEETRFYTIFSWTITFLAVVVSWVYFRAPTVEHANVILSALLGQEGANLPRGIVVRVDGLGDLLPYLAIGIGEGGGASLVKNYALVLIAALIALCLPNVAQIFHKYSPVLYERPTSFSEVRDNSWIGWQPSGLWAAWVALALLLGILTLTQISEFLYFQF